MKRRSLALLLFFFLASFDLLQAREFLATGQQGAVSTGHELATRAALEMLSREGNAVDAAVAAGFMLAVVDPSNSGIGGDGFALLRLPSGKFESWDASSSPPAAGLNGSSTIGIPTEPSLLLELLGKYGTKSPAEVMAPAISASRDGFPVSAYLERRIEEKLRMFRDEEALNTFAPQGRPLRAGELLRQPALAVTLERLAAQGASDLYSGALSRILAADLASRGSFYNVDDIRNVRPRVSRPISVTVGPHTLVGPPPPCSAVAVMSGIKSIFDAERLSGSRLSPGERLILLERLLERMTRSLADSVGFPGRFLRAPNEASGQRPENDNTPSFPAAGEAPGETTHLVVWDRRGMIVSMTLTLGTHFGTGAYSPLGFFYNNELANFGTSHFTYPPGYPKDAGPISTKSPLILLRGNKPVLALGGAGAGRIVSNLVLILDAVMHGEQSIHDAVMSPRYHISGRRRLLIEWSPTPLDPTVASAFPAYTIRPAGSDFFGLVSAVGIASSGFVAVGDYRRDGSAGAIDVAPSVISIPR
ncbi:gamma-glutamyltransferase [Candidatus Ozemobacteraceae bacterium]|nr:gamma-glutamyltransferase [Candidatus Ozemobacteraceae bacterium]